MVNLCCLLDVKWIGHGSGVLSVEQKRYNLWCSRIRDGVGGVGLILEELCGYVVKV